VRLIRSRAVPFALVLLASLLPASAQSQWQVIKTLPVGGEGGFDYITVDAQTHRLFVPRTTHTMVIDENSGKVLGDIPGQTTAHGVALVPKLGRGFITDGGGTGSIVIFDLKTYKVLGKIDTMPDSDGIIYDEGQNRILVSAGDSSALITFKPDIDPQSGKMEAPITLGGKPEFLAADGRGKVYINLEDKDVVAVVDLASRQVTARWPVTPGGHPVGMSMDAKTHRLFVGCRKPQKLVVISTTDGKVEGSVDIGAGVDATAVHEGHAFASCRDGSLSVVSEKAGKIEVEQVVKTRYGAKTLGVDAATHRIYLPTAEFETTSAPRPKAKPNTFMIVVVGGQ
jgi:DNA-binding beta-propeller fold protein YncE